MKADTFGKTFTVDQLVNSYLPLARQAANIASDLDYDEAFSAAMDGLLSAATEFNSSRGAFPGFAKQRIVWAISRFRGIGKALKRGGGAVKISLDAPLGEDGDEISEVIPDDAVAEPHANISEKEQAASIRRMVGRLPEDDRKIVALRFGLNGEVPLSVTEICARLSISVGKVQTVLTRSLDRLKRITDQAEDLSEAAIAKRIRKREYTEKTRCEAVERMRQWISLNREKHREHCRNWRKRNPERTRKYRRSFYLRNGKAMREKTASYFRKLKETNPEKIREYKGRYYQKNRTQILARNRLKRKGKAIALNQRQRDKRARLADPYVKGKLAAKLKCFSSILTPQQVEEYRMILHMKRQRRGVSSRVGTAPLGPSVKKLARATFLYEALRDFRNSNQQLVKFARARGISPTILCKINKRTGSNFTVSDFHDPRGRQSTVDRRSLALALSLSEADGKASLAEIHRRLHEKCVTSGWSIPSPGALRRSLFRLSPEERLSLLNLHRESIPSKS